MPRKFPPEVRRQVIDLARSGTRVAPLVCFIRGGSSGSVKRGHSNRRLGRRLQPEPAPALAGQAHTERVLRTLTGRARFRCAATLAGSSRNQHPETHIEGGSGNRGCPRLSTSSTLRKISPLSTSSRIDPLKRSTNAFCWGLPFSMKA